MTSQPMQRALAASRAVRGFTSPNPWVGAALEIDGNVVAVGATAPPGGPHAEAQVLEDGVFPGATVYTTLEPCMPFPGKRTPACAEALVRARVGRVVIALLDPDPAVAGSGVALLRSAGIDVEIGDGAEEAAALLRPYLKHRQTGLPYVIAKFASSLDGRTATATGDSQWITGPAARDLGHQQRAWVDAVMVGSGTVLADNPSLTARPNGVTAPHQPARVVLDARGRTPPNARLFDEGGPVIIVAGRAAPRSWREAIVARGGQVLECEMDDYGVNLSQALAILARRSILSIWAEGGGTVLGSLFDEGHIDELWAFIAPKILGGTGLASVGGHGVTFAADAVQLRDIHVERLGDDVLIRGYAGEWDPTITVGSSSSR